MNTKKLAVVVVMLVVAGLAVTGCARKGTKTAGGAAGLTKVHFDFDKYNIRPVDEGTMKANAGWMQANKNTKTVIEGHCDERGTAEYNIALGDRRAKSTKNYLQNLGVAADRLSTVSFGEERPIATCNNESCWSQNRRAEFVAK